MVPIKRSDDGGGEFRIFDLPQDQKVTVWLGAASRPVAIFSKMFSQSVTDVAWTPDGHTLLACSNDGTVAAVRVPPTPFFHTTT